MASAAISEGDRLGLPPAGPTKAATPVSCGAGTGLRPRGCSGAGMMATMADGDRTQAVGIARRTLAFVFVNSRVLVRTILGLIGLGTLLLGVIAAWRSNAATPLLLAGVVLGTLAVFGDRITDVTVRWRDNEVSARLLQPLKEEVDRMAEGVEGEDVPEPVKKRLHELSNRVREIQASATSPNRIEHPPPYTATHLIAESGDVLLQLRGPGQSPVFRFGQARCVVTDPSRATFTAQGAMEPKLGSGSMWSEVTFRWPDDFPSAGVSSGKHVVDWFINDYLSATWWPSGLGRRVAIDAFET